MKARDIQTFFHSLRGNWQYPDDTVDTFKSGDPDSEVTGIAVGWMSYSWALQRAVALGCNVFITHEPTYYNHHDNDPNIFRFEIARKKRQFIEENKLTIIRCHDLWDQLTGDGIPDSWGKFLGLGRQLNATEFCRIYDTQGKTAQQIATHVSARTMSLGQPAVQLIGNPERSVSRVAIGTGAITPYFEYIEELDADMAICTDDGIWYWRDGAFAIDGGIPLLIVHHAVSEEMGVANLATRLEKQFPTVAVHHIPQTCMYQLVTSA